MSLPAVTFGALVGGAVFGAAAAVAAKLADIAMWRWVKGGSGRTAVSLREVAVAALAALGDLQERHPPLRSLSSRMHDPARLWLGERDPGSGAWLAGKEAAALAAGVLGGWLLGSVVLALSFAAAAFFVPDFLARDRYERRQRRVRRELPDVVDLLSLAFEAGLGVDASFKAVAERSRGGMLGSAITKMLGRVRFGARRHQAWREMAAGIGSLDFTEVVTALVQADTMGVGLAESLRKLADQMRIRRRHQVEENAQKAPVKLLFPLAFLIFPAIFVVLFGPVILNMMEVFG